MSSLDGRFLKNRRSVGQVVGKRREFAFSRGVQRSSSPPFEYSPAAVDLRSCDDSLRHPHHLDLRLDPIGLLPSRELQYCR